MPSLRAFVTAAAGALAFVANAHAADMPQWYPPVRTVEPVTASSSGWYLRADIGYRATSIKSAAGAPGFPAPTDNSLDGTFWGGVGAGFKWGSVRTDLTVDYGSDTNYTGSNGAASATARIQTITGLANFYYDIGTWRRITPYLGAGAGIARVSLSDYQSTTIPPLSNVGNFGSFNFAWALMAGANYQLSSNLSVDVGYRFLDQGDAKTATDTIGSLTLMKLQSHEARIGLRWMYDSPSSYMH
jgi:opacity protein-like surface antigen